RRMGGCLLARNEPRGCGTVARPADAQALALAERVVRESGMATEDPPLRSFDWPGRPRQIAGEKVAKGPLADETDARGILLGVSRYPLLARHRTHLPLGEIADRKAGGSKLTLRELMQEVRLILGGIGSLQQLD